MLIDEKEEWYEKLHRWRGAKDSILSESKWEDNEVQNQYRKSKLTDRSKSEAALSMVRNVVTRCIRG